MTNIQSKLESRSLNLMLWGMSSLSPQYPLPALRNFLPVMSPNSMEEVKLVKPTRCLPADGNTEVYNRKTS